MKATLKYFSLLSVTTLLLAGCGGGGGSSPAAPQPGALEAGGSGIAVDQVIDGTGATVTANFSTALDINDNLDVIGVAEVTAGSPFSAALWTVDAAGAAAVAPMALVPLVDNGFTAAFAIDENGTPVGQADDGTRLVAVRWPNGSGAPIELPQLAAAGNYAAYAVSADGTLIAGAAVDATGITRAVVWRADGNGDFVAAPLALPVNIFANGAALSPFNAANGIARVGAAEILVVGEAEAGNGTLHAALWRSVDGGGIYAPIDLGASHIAYAVNSARQVVGENEDTLAPVSWSVSDQGVAAAPVALAAAGSAVAINDNGRIAGWSGTPDLATVWNGTTPATLFTTVSQANGLNNDVQPLVVGRNGSAGFIKRAN
ncbi:hypothetical protein [Geoalkalibacter sp.]|uniref:hypothetical protein n=1 Tax=Geoalkalibacter sp. TaxID=3041440 RepID=UPI00272E8E0B|nr:hypothetical protein [Geoalkalibacter sp.]